MTRLSIVIPCLDGAEQFEVTLASVLQNRPPRCEIIVLQPRTYDDPYDLAGEVRFVEVSSAETLVELINRGLRVARGDIVHLLSCDTEVADGWTDAAIECFSSATVGCVVPRLVDQESPNRTIAIGITMQRSGTSCLLQAEPAASAAVIGPTRDAGFYRRRILLELGGFSTDVGIDSIGLDVASRMRALGYETVVAATSLVYSRRASSLRPMSIHTGRCAERLFWRQTRRHDRTGVWLSHVGTVVGELARNWYQPRCWLHFLGHALELAASRKAAIVGNTQATARPLTRPPQTRSDSSDDSATTSRRHSRAA